MNKKKHNKQKVFCIGWHKTGTTTLGDALLTLGYTVLGARLDMAEYLIKGDFETPIQLVANFDAVQDVPWAALYKELDQAYPGSKFILTVRDEKKWLNSAANHFGDSFTLMRKWLYGNGVLRGNEDLYLERYRRHYKEVKAYFENRPDDLLIMDLSIRDGWDKLCTFLDKPLPKKAFPHSNKGIQSLKSRDRFVQYIQNLVPMPIRKLRLYILNLLGRKDARNRFNNRSENQKVRMKNSNNG
jgi:hypothetical protein